jgi:hypothetical protein
MKVTADEMTVQTIEISKASKVEAIWTDEKTPQLESASIVQCYGLQEICVFVSDDLDKVIEALAQLQKDRNTQIKLKSKGGR